MGFGEANNNMTPSRVGYSLPFESEITALKSAHSSIDFGNFINEKQIISCIFSSLSCGLLSVLK